jgi:hypothetical protein
VPLQKNDKKAEAGLTGNFLGKNPVMLCLKMSAEACWNFYILLVLTSSIAVTGQTPMLGLTYCTESSPLDTKYFVPFYESHVPVSGCVSRERSSTQAGYQVHVIRINTTYKEVMLHFNGKHRHGFRAVHGELQRQRDL